MRPEKSIEINGEEKHSGVIIRAVVFVMVERERVTERGVRKE